MGATYNQAPTASNTYPTAVYTQEYDPVADFPQYPLNIVSDLNATLGFITQHLGYLDLTPQQINSAVQLPTTGGNTQYYTVPTPNLPLLAPVRLIPLIGNPLADLVQPDLRVIVNLGYGSITNGYSSGPANVPTPFGLIPTNINLSDLATALVNGIPTGITNALNDLKSPQLFDLSPLGLFFSGAHTAGFTPSDTPSLLQVLNGFATLNNGGVPVTSSGGIVPTLSNVITGDLAVAKPLADTVTALAVTLPQYNAQLFTSQLQAGNPIGAIGLPIAADAGLIPWTVLVGGIFPVVGAVATTVTQVAQLTGLEPNPTGTAAATASTKAQPALSAKAGARTANTTNGVQSVVNTAVSSVTTPVRSAVSSVITPVRTALTRGSEPVTAAVSKPTTPAVSPVTTPVRTAISSVTTPVRTALTRGSKPVTTPVSKPTTPAAVTGAPTVKPAAGHGKKR